MRTLRFCVLLLAMTGLRALDQSKYKAVPDDPINKENFKIAQFQNSPDSIPNRMWNAITRGGPYTKPDDKPREIPRPGMSKPEEWDDEEDGAWEVEMVKNPEYKPSSELVDLLEQGAKIRGQAQKAKEAGVVTEEDGSVFDVKNYPGYQDVQKSSITLLQWATYLNNTAAVRVLLEYGADANLVNDNGDSAMSNAVMNGQLEHVDLLLKAGARPTTMERNFLEEAISAGHDDIAIRLLEGGAHPNLGGQIHNSIQNCHHLQCVDVVRKLVEAGADPKAEKKILGNHYTALRLLDIVKTADVVKAEPRRLERVLGCRDVIIDALGGDEAAYLDPKNGKVAATAAAAEPAVAQEEPPKDEL